MEEVVVLFLVDVVDFDDLLLVPLLLRRRAPLCKGNLMLCYYCAIICCVCPFSFVFLQQCQPFRLLFLFWPDLDAVFVYFVPLSFAMPLVVLLIWVWNLLFFV